MQCMQTLISQNNDYHATVTFKLCSVTLKEQEAAFESITPHGITLEVKMCMLNSETTKLIFKLHDETAAHTAVHTLGYYELSGDSTTELAKMTYLSPCIELPVGLKYDTESEGALSDVGYIDAGSWIPEMLHHRKESDAQGSIRFIGPATLTWAIGQRPTAATDPALYYVQAVQKYEIRRNYSKKPNLIDGMVALHRGNTSLGEENDVNMTGVGNFSHKYRPQLIAFDNTITQLIKTNRDEEKEKEKEKLGTWLRMLSSQHGIYTIETSDPRPGRGNGEGYSRSLPHGLVFYEEINKCTIPNCEHQPLQNIS